MKLSAMFKDKRVRYGGYSVLMTIVAVAILIAVNLVAGQLDLKWDLSSNKLYSVSDETVKALNELEADVTIYALFPSNSANITYKEIIEQYPANSGRVKLEYRDPHLYPTFISQYTGGEDVPEYSLIVVSGQGALERSRVISSKDFVRYERDYYTFQEYPVALEIEPLLTGAIRLVCDPNSPVAYTLAGHEDYALPQYVAEQFTREGYDLRELNIIQTGAIPADCDVLILTTPKWDITPAEKDEINRYLSVGGAAAFLLDMTSAETPNLDALLAEYGLSLSRHLLVETDPSLTVQSVPYCLLPSLAEHEINAPLIEKDSRVIAMLSQSVDELEISRRATNVFPLLVTSGKSYGKSMTGFDTVEKEPGDPEGPFDIAVAVMDYTDHRNPSRMIVTGTTTILESSMNSTTGGANLNFFMNAMAWLTEKGESYYIPSKTFTNEPLQMNGAHQTFVFWMCVVLIPLAILAFGMARWFIRKNK